MCRSSTPSKRMIIFELIRISLFGGLTNVSRELRVNINNFAKVWLFLIVVKMVDIDSSFNFKECKFIS